VHDGKPRRDSLIFAVNVWHRSGPGPGLDKASTMRFVDISDWFPGPAELLRGPAGRIAKIGDRLKEMDDAER